MAMVLVNKTVKDFGPNDALLYNKEKRKWYRFLENGDGTMSVFQGNGNEAKQEWHFMCSMKKDYVRSLWDNAVKTGFVRMTL